jgi:hypothetical protein
MTDGSQWIGVEKRGWKDQVDEEEKKELVERK